MPPRRDSADARAADRPPARWITSAAPGVLAALVCYATSLGNGFTYDDNPIVRDNPRIRSLANLPQIWLSDWWLEFDAPIQDPSRDRLYRPLTMFSFALNYAADGLRPLGYHAVNVALHALCCALVWRLTRRLTGRDEIAAIASVLFAVHPIHVEAVANVVGRAEVLAALFLLLGLDRLTRASGPPSLAATILAGASFLAALFSKETAVCYLPVAALALLAACRSGSAGARAWAIRAAILATPLAIYLGMRVYALESRLIREQITSGLFNPMRDADGLARVHGPLTILGHYTRLHFAPAQLSCDYGLAIFDPNNGPELLTLVGAAAAIGLLAALGGAASRSDTRRQLALCAGVFLLSYALISNTALLIGVSLAERLMYWPSVPVLIGVSVAAGAFWRRYCAAGGAMRDRAGLLRGLGAALLVALALRTAVRNLDWADDLTLFSADTATHPRGAHLSASLAQLRIWQAQVSDSPEQARAFLDEAAALADRALAVSSRFPDALRLRGHACLLQGDMERARAFVEGALLLNPADAKAQRLLAQIRGGDERLKAREQELLARVADPASSPGEYVELGRCLIDLGRHYDALAALREGLAKFPSDAEMVRACAEALLINHQQAEALAMLRRAVELNPQDWQSHANLARLLAERAPLESLRHARRANELAPDDVRTQINLAEAFAQNGERDESLRRYRRIEQALPVGSPLRAAVADRIREIERSRP